MADSIKFEIKATATGFDIVQKKQKELVKQTDQQAKSQNKAKKSGDNLDKQNKSLYQTNLAGSKSFSKMNQTIGTGGSSGLVGAYATLAANVFAATAAFSALRQASQVQQLVAGLDALGAASGQNLRLLAQGIKTASGEAIALDQALRVASVGASASFSGAQLEGLATVARSAAIALGRDVGDAIDRLARGAAKLEPEILDELGIFVRLDDASAKYAASIGKSTSELTRFEQRQAFANEIISQGTDKFSEIGDAVDVSPFDKLAASLSDVGRAFIDFFNKVLGPLANFLANNTLALSGLIMVLTKGLIGTALPVLNTFAAKAAQASAAAFGMVSATQRGIESQITAIAGGQARIKGIRGEYAKNFKIIKSGDASVKMLKATNKDLETYILGAQKRIAAGEVKNIGLIKQRIDQANTQIAQNKQLMDLSGQRIEGAPKVRASSADASFSKRQGSIFKDLDKDPSFKGYKKAFALSNRANKRYVNNVRASGAETKLFGVSLGFLGKPLKVAGAGVKAFGFSAKVAIKGIFTAIPFIGQLLLVLDLLVIGLVKAVKFLGSFRAEATTLEKTTKALGSQMKFVAENTTEAALANKSAAESLVISGNAAKELVKRQEQQADAARKARKETNAFGKLFQGLFLRLEFGVKKFLILFNGLDGAVKRVGISFQIAFATAIKFMRPVLNAAIRVINWMNEGTGIEPIELIDGDEQTKRIRELQGELGTLAEARTRLLSSESLSIFGVTAGTSDTLDAFIIQLNSGGKAADELNAFLGGVDINGFAKQIQEANSSKSLAGFSPGVREAIEASGTFSDQLLDTNELVVILGDVLQQGTKESIRASDAVQSLGETFKNSKEKIAEFYNTFNKKSSFSTFGTLLSSITKDVKILGEDSGNSAEIIETLGVNLSGAFGDFVNNAAGVKPLLDRVNEELLLQKMNGVEITEELRNQIKVSHGLAKPYEEALIAGEKLVNQIIEAQLHDAARVKTLTSQANIVKSMGKGTEASEKLRISLGNRAVAINTARMKDEIAFQEQTLGLESGKLVTAKQYADMSTEEKEKYATLLDARVALNMEGAKEIGLTEELALLGVAENEQKKRLLNLTQAQNATLNSRVKTTAILANLESGLGGKLSPAQQLAAQKVLESQKTKALEAELALQDARIRFELTIADLRMAAMGIDAADRKLILDDLGAQLKVARDITAEKIKASKNAETQVGAGNFEGLQSKGTFASTNTAFDLAKEELATDAGKGTQGKLEIMNDALAPMREQLEALGPGGELISTAQQGMLTLASSFDVIKDKGLGSAEGLAAIGSAVTAVSAMMQSSARAQVAEMDNQIKAEQARDGKSKESVAKIAAMEKKKEGIQRKAFEQKKKMDIASAVIRTALGITRALELGPIIGPILAVMQGAMGMAQIAIIKKQQFQGGSSGDIAPPASTIAVGGNRSNKVDVSQGASSGETAYLRGGSGVGSNANNFTPGAAMGRKGYADGGMLVGERGPEVVTPNEVIPNYALGGSKNMNLTFNVSALDGASVQEILTNNQGAVIGAIRDAANSYGQDFLPDVNVGYGGKG